MSRFFKVLNNISGTSSNIDDENVSTDTTYSSYQITQLFNLITAKVPQFSFKEYASDIRASPQKIFETPDSSKGDMWVLREGVKMTKNIDYTVLDTTHVAFINDVSAKYTVSILVFGGNSPIENPGDISIFSEPLIFSQDIETTSWELTHNVGFQYPNLDIVDNTNHRITDMVDIEYVDDNKCIISSEIPFKGKCIIYK